MRMVHCISYRPIMHFWAQTGNVKSLLTNELTMWWVTYGPVCMRFLLRSFRIFHTSLLFPFTNVNTWHEVREQYCNSWGTVLYCHKVDDNSKGRQYIVLQKLPLTFEKWHWTGVFHFSFVYFVRIYFHIRTHRYIYVQLLSCSIIHCVDVHLALVYYPQI